MSDLYVWDFTLKYNEDVDVNLLKDNLREVCKRWVFQLEESDNGYIHYQGRISLIKRKTLSSLIKLFSNFDAWTQAHFSPTATANTKSFSYVMKLDTRKEGPWADTDKIIVETKQMKLFKSWGLLEWQHDLIKTVSKFDLRFIDLVYDPTGNAGKSLLTEFMEIHHNAEEVPPFRLMEDIFQWVYGRPTALTYIIDMPRGMKKDKLGDFYSGVEVIKNGVAYDKRYTAKKKRFDRPRIIIFTNTLPEFDLMSKDRWKVWIIDNNKLKEYYQFKINEKMNELMECN